MNMDKQKKSTGNGFGIAGLVLGIISIPAFWYPLVGIAFGILGIIFSVMGLKKSQSFAFAGYTCILIGLSFSVINALIGAILGASGLI